MRSRLKASPVLMMIIIFLGLSATTAFSADIPFSLAPRYMSAAPNKVLFINEDMQNGVYRLETDSRYELIILKDGMDYAAVYTDEDIPQYGPALRMDLLADDMTVFLPVYHGDSPRAFPYYVRDNQSNTTVEFGMEDPVQIADHFSNSGNGFFIINDTFIFMSGVALVRNRDGMGRMVNTNIIFPNSKNERQEMAQAPVELQEHVARVLEDLAHDALIDQDTGDLLTNFFVCGNPTQCQKGEYYLGGASSEQSSLAQECQVLPDCCCDDGQGLDANGKCRRPIALVPGAFGDSDAGAMGEVKSDSKNNPCEANTFGLNRPKDNANWPNKGKEVAKAINDIKEKCGGAAVEAHGLCAGALVLGEAVPYINGSADLHFWNGPFKGPTLLGPIAGGVMDTVSFGMTYFPHWASREQDSIRWGGVPDKMPRLGAGQTGTCHVGVGDMVVGSDSQSACPEGSEKINHDGGHGMIAGDFEHKACCGDGMRSNNITRYPPEDQVEQCDDKKDGGRCDVIGFYNGEKGTCKKCKCIPDDTIHPYCGDGKVLNWKIPGTDKTYGEQCDPPGKGHVINGKTYICDSECRLVLLTQGACGDHMVQSAPLNRPAEQCDPPFQACATPGGAAGMCDGKCQCVASEGPITPGGLEEY